MVTGVTVYFVTIKAPSMDFSLETFLPYRLNQAAERVSQRARHRERAGIVAAMRREQLLRAGEQRCVAARDPVAAVLVEKLDDHGERGRFAGTRRPCDDYQAIP